MRQQARGARCGRAVAVEYGIAGAGRAWGVVNADRIALCPGHIIFAIGGGGSVARGKGGTALHPHVARDDDLYEKLEPVVASFCPAFAAQPYHLRRYLCDMPG